MLEGDLIGRLFIYCDLQHLSKAENQPVGSANRLNIVLFASFSFIFSWIPQELLFVCYLSSKYDVQEL